MLDINEIAIFSFFMTAGKTSFNKYKNMLSFGKYSFYYSKNTKVEVSTDGRVLIVGDCLNVKTGKTENIADFLSDSSNSMSDIVEKEWFLGGNYAIFFQNGENCYAMGDAICSIQINYGSIDGNFFCSSNCYDIAYEGNLEEDYELLKIKKSGGQSQALPFDVTVYKEIKQLLPNHYLDINTRKPVRFINMAIGSKKLDPKEAAAITAPMILNLAKEYNRRYSVVCPITAGRDSRIVLSVLHSINPEMSCFTIKHDWLKEDAGDVVIPPLLAKSIDIKHELLLDEKPDNSVTEYLNAHLNPGLYADSTVMIANTIKNRYPNFAIINGEIAGHIGKSGVMGDMPDRFITSGFLRCKLHNFSRESKKYLKHWLDDVKASGEATSIGDLFAIENRLARQATQVYLINNLLGLASLNIFNSRSIIYTWTKVERSQRVKCLISYELIRIFEPKLLETRFQIKRKSTRIAKSNNLFLLLAIYLKWHLNKFAFSKNKARNEFR